MKGLFVVCAVLLAAVQFVKSEAIGSCPAENRVPDVLLPDSVDCGVFYKCNWGTPVLFNCQLGLYFNTVTDQCDYGPNVNCDRTELGTNDSGEEVGDFVPQPLLDCPVVDGKYPLYMPDKVDCTKYYVCVFGTPVMFTCPEGLLYDGRIWTCNYPVFVTCGAYAPLGDDGIPGSDGSAPSPPSEDGGLTPWVGECPEEATDELVLLPSRNDPTKFYSCVGDTPYELSCPSGLIYNANLQVCDYPQ